MRHAPLWFDRLPKARRPSFPRLRGPQTARVVIVGGGLTGAACALTFATSGIDVVVLESAAIGGGMTAGDPGLLREGFAASFQAAAGRYGLKTSRAVAEALRRGSLDFAAALRRAGIKCDLEPRDLITCAAATTDAGRLLRREYQARRDAGLAGTWLTPAAVAREVAVESAGGIKTPALTLDPYRACVGIIASAVARGARVHEQSKVGRIRTAKNHVEVVTDGGSVRAEAVVVATAAPIQDLRGLRRHLRAEHAYGVLTAPLPAAVRRQVGPRRAVVEPAAEPGRVVRWMADDRVLVHGARQPEVPARNRERAATQRSGQLMYELSLVYPAISGIPAALSWDGLDYETVDGLPFLGPHRNYPRHLFAYGSSRHGAGLAWVAARVALRHFQGEPVRDDEALGFQRIL
jgi:glycine/D-amino acid oxidase-like deaminating enzyme